MPKPGAALRIHVHVNPASMLAGEITRERVLTRLGGEDGVALSLGMTADELEAALPETEVLLLTGQAPLQELRRRAPRLRWISYTSAGVDWLIEAGLPDGVVLTNASGTHVPKAAEFALAAVLMLNLRIPTFATAMRAHRWQQISGGTVAGRTALILGMGALGGAAADALKAQGVRIVGNSRSGAAHPSADVMTRGGEFRAHLPRTDFLLITLPLTAETRGLVGAAELDLLPPTAGVVNIGRGEILDDAALARRLTDGRLSGAVLDALPREPLPPESPLWDTPNLIITPHCGLYDPTGYGPRCLDLFAANVRRYRSRETLHQIVEPTRGY